MLGVELGKVRSVFSIPFWHIQFTTLMLQWARGRSRASVKSAWEHSSTFPAIKSSPEKLILFHQLQLSALLQLKLGSHPLFSWSLCHLLITISLQLSRCPLCAVTWDLQDTLWSTAQVNLDFYCFFSMQHFSSSYETLKTWLSTLLSCSFDM